MLTQRRFLLAVFSAIALLGSAYSAYATQSELIATPFTGADTSVRIVLDDDPAGGGDIEVTLTVNEGLADLRGFFLNIENSSLLEGLSVTGDDVTGFEIENNGVTNLKHGVNMNGGGSPCPCDLGIAIGTPGIGEDDIFTTTFVLHVPNLELVLDDFAGGLIGIRVTSVGGVGGDAEDDAEDSKDLEDLKKDCKDEKDGGDGKDGRHGSSKLVATITDPIIPVPEPSTAALIALGLGTIGYASRSRR